MKALLTSTAEQSLSERNLMGLLPDSEGQIEGRVGERQEIHKRQYRQNPISSYAAGNIPVQQRSTQTISGEGRWWVTCICKVHTGLHRQGVDYR
jgi:hypothetical protein